MGLISTPSNYRDTMVCIYASFDCLTCENRWSVFSGWWAAEPERQWCDATELLPLMYYKTRCQKVIRSISMVHNIYKGEGVAEVPLEQRKKHCAPSPQRTVIQWTWAARAWAPSWGRFNSRLPYWWLQFVSWELPWNIWLTFQFQQAIEKC
jgi:hypothetical protein